MDVLDAIMPVKVKLVLKLSVGDGGATTLRLPSPALPGTRNARARLPLVGLTPRAHEPPPLAPPPAGPVSPVPLVAPRNPRAVR